LKPNTHTHTHTQKFSRFYAHSHSFTHTHTLFHIQKSYIRFHAHSKCSRLNTYSSHFKKTCVSGCKEWVCGVKKEKKKKKLIFWRKNLNAACKGRLCPQHWTENNFLSRKFRIEAKTLQNNIWQLIYNYHNSDWKNDRTGSDWNSLVSPSSHCRSGTCLNYPKIK
jgi:hypothetical protein